MGGTVTYKWLSGSKYAIEFVIYRDCNGQALSGSYTYTVKKSSSTSTPTSKNRTVYKTGSAKKVTSNISGCATTTYCVERYYFRDTIDIVNLVGNDTVGWHVWVQDGNRNASIANLSSPSGLGMTWYCFIPANKYQNSSPNLTKEPVPTVCKGKTNIFNAGFFDPDGDSMVFSFATPWNSGGSPPTFTNVSFKTGYSLTYPFGTSSPAVKIDANTGEITATANSTGNYVISVEINEYRVDKITHKATYMGKVRVDLQYIVVSCSNASNPPPQFVADSLGGVYTTKVGEQLCFKVTGVDTTLYNSKYDTVRLSATGALFGKVGGFSSPFASFDGDTTYKIATSQFCWTPGCAHITYSGPHLVTFRIEDDACNMVEKTYSIYVKTPGTGLPVLSCINPLSSGIIHLGWTPVTADSNFNSYHIYRKKVTDASFEKVKSITTRTVSSWEDSSVSHAWDTAYQYFITSANYCGVEVKTTDTLQTVHLASTVLANGSTKLTWNTINPKVKDSFLVKIDTGLGLVPLAWTKNRNYTVIMCGKNFTAQVVQFNPADSCYSYSNTTGILPWDTTRPVKNTIRNVTVFSGSRIDISFNKSSSDDVKDYFIYRSVNGGSFSLVGQVTSFTTTTGSYSDTTVNAVSSQYCYRVSAVDNCGNEVKYDPHCAVKLSATASNLKSNLSWALYSGYTLSRQSVERYNGTSWINIADLSATATSFIDSNVTCAEYTYRVASYEKNGNLQVSYSNEVKVSLTDTIKPSEPAIKTLYTVSGSEIRFVVNYTRPKDLTRFRIYEWKNDVGPTFLEEIKVPATSTWTYKRNTGIDALGNIYRYAVQAVDSCGNRSTYSDKGSIKLDVASLNLAAKLTWNAPHNFAVNKYYVYEKIGSTYYLRATLASTDTSWNHTGLKCKTSHEYSITARNLSSDSVSSNLRSVNINDTVAPDAPKIRYATVKSGTSIELSFTKSTDPDLRKYYIYVSENGGAYKKADSINSTGASSYMYTYTGINPVQKTYSFYVRAIDTCAGNMSVPGDTHQVVQLSAVAGNLKSYLSWTTYQGFSVDKYYIQKWKSGAWTLLDSVGGSSTAYTDTKNLHCNKIEYYRIYTKKNSSVFYLTYSDSASVTPYDSIAPAEVNIRAITTINGSKISISFDTVADLDVNRYRLYVKKNSGAYSLLTTLTNPTTNPVTYIHTGINTLTDTFSYRIFAVDSCADNISATAETHRSIQLSGSAGNYENKLAWSKYRGFTVKNYVVQRWQGSWKDLDTLTGGDSLFTDGPIQCQKTQYYRIRAVEDGGDGMATQSDSIALTPFDTARPAAPEITYATYASASKINLTWQKSTANDVRQYIIFRKSGSSAFTAIDTVGDVNSYSDDLPSTLYKQYCYAIKAMDSCVNNVSAFSGMHCPVIVLADTNSCNQKIYVDWSAYQGWPAGVKQYNIYKKEQGGSESLLDTVPGNIIAYVDTLIDHNITYCYRIEAMPVAGTFTSTSPSSCESTYDPELLIIHSVSKLTTSTTNGKILVKWQSVKGKRFYAYYNIYHKSSNDTAFTLLQANIPIAQDSFIHTGINTATEDHAYRFTIVDSCGNNKRLYSTQHKTMNLFASVGQLTHKLWWTPYEGFAVDSYFVQRLEGGVFKTLKSFSSDTQTVIFPAPCNFNIFYRIMAIDAEGDFSYSDTVGRQAIDTIAANAPVLQNASVISGSSVAIDFIGADSADMYTHVIQRANSGVWGTAGSVDFTTPAKQIQFIDNTNTLDDYLCYTVISLDSCLNISSSDTFCIPQLKGKPMNQANEISWHPFKGYEIKGYKVHQWRNNKWNLLGETGATDTTFYEDTLHCDLPYHYKVEAIGMDGLRVSFSDSITLTPFDTALPPPAQMRYISANEDQSVEVAWRYDNKSDVKYFEVWRSDDGNNFSLIGKTVFDSIFTDKTASPGTIRQSYYVISIDSCDMTHRSIASDTDIASFVTITNGDCNPKLFLNWVNYGNFSAGTKQIEVYRRGQYDIVWEHRVTLPPGSTSYTDPVPSKDSTYCYRLVATSNDGKTVSNSGIFCGKPWIFPLPDSAGMVYATVTHTGSTNGSIRIEWPAYDSVKDTFARGYRLYHQSGGAGSFTLLHDEKDLKITSFVHQNVNTAGDENRYYIAVYNLCDREGIQSETHRVLNLDIDNTNLRAYLHWKPYQGEEVTAYELYKVKNTSVPVLLATLSASDSFYTDTQLLCQQHYVYALRANLKNGKISMSDSAGITAFDDTPPVRPDIFTATIDQTDKTNGEISINYTGNSEPNRSAYNLYRSVNNGSYKRLVTLTDLSLAALYFKDSLLDTKANTYSYFFTALDSCGNESAGSDTHTVVHLDVKAFSEYNRITWTHHQGYRNWKYSIERREMTGPWIKIAALASSVNSYSDSDVICHRFYEYRIVAEDSDSGALSVSNLAGDTAFETVLPIPPVIKAASVTVTGLTTGVVHLEWAPSVSRDAYTYRLERSENGTNWYLLASLIRTYSYDDNALNTSNQSYYYRIWVVDSCGNLAAAPAVFHRTVVVKAKPGNQFIDLKWNTYQGWAVKEYKIYKNNQLLYTAPGSMQQFRDTMVLCIDYYTYRVEAVSFDNTIAVSNNDSALAWDNNPPRVPYLRTATVSVPNSQVKLEWNASTSWDVSQYYIYKRAAQSGTLDFIDSTAGLSYTIAGGIAQPDCYAVVAKDYCSNISPYSNLGCPIILEAKNGNGFNELRWNAYYHWRDGVQRYDIYKKEDGENWDLIATTQDLYYKDEKLGDDVVSYCYRIEAKENTGLNNASSLSTVQCASQDPLVYFPNSFTPYITGGTNDVFGPRGMYIDDYDMVIYNRWGQVAYQTDSGTPWDGRMTNGAYAPDGVYVYFITIKGLNRDKGYFKGSVTIFR